MSETLSKVFALILAVLLLYVFPVENMLTRQDDITRVFVLNETAQFVDSVRNLGYITPVMYRQFSEVLSTTGNLYAITMEHRHGRIDPVYTDPVDITSFQHDYGYHDKAIYTDEILNKLFPSRIRLLQIPITIFQRRLVFSSGNQSEQDHSDTGSGASSDVRFAC